MFEELDDPRPPAFGAPQLTAAVARSRRKTQRQAFGRRLALAASAVIALAGIMAVVVDESGDDEQVAVTATTTDTTSTTTLPTETAPPAPPVTDPPNTEPEPTTTTVPPLGDSACYQAWRAQGNSAPAPPEMTLDLVLDRPTVSPGESIVWTAMLRNNSDHTVIYGVDGATQGVLTWITDEKGTVLWDDAHGVGFAAGGPDVAHPPGEELIASGTAEQALCTDPEQSGGRYKQLVDYPPGQYYVRASWYSLWSDPVPLQVS